MINASKLSAMDKTELKILYLTLMRFCSQVRKQIKSREKLLPLLKQYFNEKSVNLTKHQKPEIAVSVLRLNFDYNTKYEKQGE